MSFSSLLINTCTIQRYTAGAQDTWGNPAKTWTALHTNEPCRWSTPVNREVKVGAEVVLAELQLFLDDIDVIEQDRVILEGRIYEILSVMRRQDSHRGEDIIIIPPIVVFGSGEHHKELLIRVVK